MSESIRLAKRLAAQVQCSRSQAEHYIEGGWVSVDGIIAEDPACRVGEHQEVTLASRANLEPIKLVTIVLHKPAGYDARMPQLASGATVPSQKVPDKFGANAAPFALELVRPETHAINDRQGLPIRKVHFKNLISCTPLPINASGLMVLTQDRRIVRKLIEDVGILEQECIAQVSGTMQPNGLEKLQQGLIFNGQPLPPIRVSWQNENKLRFALKAISPDQIAWMCECVGLRLVALHRLRIGRISMAQLAAGQWRYLPEYARF